MPGKLYKNDLRLARARAEGLCAADGATNPHPAGTPGYEAWQAGYEVRNTVEPVSAGAVMASWTKTQLKAWLDDHSIDYASDASKAELQTLAGIN